MSVHSSSTSLQPEWQGLFIERHDAYKTLINYTADRLSPEDLKSLLWLTDAPPKLRNYSALDVLQSLEMAGCFSERNVQKLSHFLKEIKRVDLMDKVNEYSMHYARHYSLPSAIGLSYQPGDMLRTARSISVGSRLTGFPHQETGGPPMEQVHPSTPGGWHQPSMYPGDTSPAIQNPALSQEAAVYTMFSPGASATPQYRTLRGDFIDSWQTESHSLSNSGSMHFNYSSHPSSHNASQEAFQMQRPPLPTTSEALRPGMQMPAEYYSNIMPGRNSVSSHIPPPTVQSNWYQHTSLGSISQQGDYVTNHGPFDLRSLQGNRSRHNSAADVLPRPPSQDHHRLSQPQMYNQYCTPPYNRRNPPVMGGSNFTIPPSHSQPSVQDHHSLEENLMPTQQSCGLPSRRKDYYQPPEGQPRGTNADTEFSGHQVENTNRSDAESNSKDHHLPACTKNGTSKAKKESLKELTTLTEQLLNNGELETVQRRRTNSLQRESVNRTQSLKAKKRFSLVSVSNSNNTNGGMHSTCSVGRLPEVTSTTSSRGLAMQSSSTLNSEESRLSPTASKSSTASRANRQKDTLLSRLTQQFSKVVRPHKEIEWQIKRNKLCKIIYEHSDKFLTCPYKLELDGGLGASNPKLTLYVHPYGCEDDRNINITLEVKIEIPTRPKAQRLDSRAQVEVAVSAEDREAKVMLGNRVVRESVRLNYFFIKEFLSHQKLKLSHSDSIVILISANIISVV